MGTTCFARFSPPLVQWRCHFLNECFKTFCQRFKSEFLLSTVTKGPMWELRYTDNNKKQNFTPREQMLSWNPVLYYRYHFLNNVPERRHLYSSSLSSFCWITTQAFVHNQPLWKSGNFFHCNFEFCRFCYVSGFCWFGQWENTVYSCKVKLSIPFFNFKFCVLFRFSAVVKKWMFIFN